ncbi:glutamate-5-semialdehyde dehydrogenase [Oscillospiraceae bacterium NSJ-54]|uniref:Gamma-glutamyl phosphate reductase n=1 Tax=Zongyangia hominis TaxID=2763677 RepID=A0A926EEK0_9FIRM|nr:glutamate-5-semialdehyde dehydrogenase [Zongyangia hominis]
MTQIIEIGKRAKKASQTLMCAGTMEKNRALSSIAQALRREKAAILAENAADIVAAKERGMSPSMVDRLTLTESRIEDIAAAVEKIVDLEDPVGVIETGFVRPNGLQVRKTRVPMGVVGIIFEARPNVTVDGAALCLKTGNAVILRGGKEAIRSNTALAGVMRDAIESTGLPADSVILIEDTSRESATALMKLNDYLDVLIPRGGAGLIRAVVEQATVPVIETGTGNCHIYIDKSADVQMGANIIFNAKTSRPSVCNAAETLLVHRDIAQEFLPVAKVLLDTKHVELRGDENTRSILGPSVKPVTEEDYATEFLDYILAVRVVDSLEEAIDHVRSYSSGHSECIVTRDLGCAQRFVDTVDSAAVYVNASTRFTDGGEFGFGAEIGISTQKLHARGPMGLKELTTVKYIIYGDGQVR